MDPTGQFPAIASDGLYAGSSKGEVLALDPRTGQELWRAPVGKSSGDKPVTAQGTPVLSGDLVIINSLRGTIEYGKPSAFQQDAFHRADGTPAWSIRHPEVIHLQTHQGRILCRTNSGVFALDAAQGRATWSWPPDGPREVTLAEVKGDLLLVAERRTRGGLLTALDPARGLPLWQTPLTGSRPESFAATDEGLTFWTSPRAGRGVYELTTVSLDSGRQRWTREFSHLSTASSELATAGRLVFIADATHISARELRTGEEAWRFPLSVKRTPVYLKPFDDLLLASMTAETAETADGTYHLVAVERAGELVWKLPLPNAATDLSIDGDGVAYATTSHNEGRAIAVDARTGDLLWEEPVEEGARLHLANGLLYACMTTVTALDPLSGKTLQ